MPLTSRRVYKLPDPWVPDIQNQVVRTDGFDGTGAAFTSANDAIFVPIVIPVTCTLYSIALNCTTATGNFDIGLYDENFSLMESQGSAAFSSTGRKVKTFSRDRSFAAGTLVYAAASMSSTSGQIQTLTASNVFTFVAVGIGKQASAHPLPSTASPVTYTAGGCPIFAFGVR